MGDLFFDDLQSVCIPNIQLLYNSPEFIKPTSYQMNPVNSNIFENIPEQLPEELIECLFKRENVEIEQDHIQGPYNPERAMVRSGWG